MTLICKMLLALIISNWFTYVSIKSQVMASTETSLSSNSSSNSKILSNRFIVFKVLEKNLKTVKLIIEVLTRYEVTNTKLMEKIAKLYINLVTKKKESDSNLVTLKTCFLQPYFAMLKSDIERKRIDSMFYDWMLNLRHDGIEAIKYFLKSFIGAVQLESDFSLQTRSVQNFLIEQYFLCFTFVDINIYLMWAQKGDPKRQYDYKTLIGEAIDYCSTSTNQCAKELMKRQQTNPRQFKQILKKVSTSWLSAMIEHLHIEPWGAPIKIRIEKYEGRRKKFLMTKHLNTYTFEDLRNAPPIEFKLQWAFRAISYDLMVPISMGQFTKNFTTAADTLEEYNAKIHRKIFIIGYFHLPVEVNMITKSLEKLETHYSNINSTKSNLIETTETSERNISYIIRWSIPIIIIVCVVIVIQYTYSTLLKPLSSVSIVEVESIKRGKSKKSKSAKTKSISSNRKQQQQQSITKSSSMPIIYKQKSNKIKSIQNKNSNKTI
ncbi:hypothetical protein BLOT_008583 [Blomia tropicalis]|nr:hypothetical protein BLOT_008583 [Blomia tropicalis]